MGTARRTFLLMPGHDRRKAAKAAGLAADAVALDLEDGVPEAEKPLARTVVRETVQGTDFGGREVFVRLNGPGTAHLDADIEALAGLALDGVFIAKVEDPRSLDAAIRRLGDSPPAVFAMIETARGLIEVERIAAVDGLAGLFFGLGDFALSTGIELGRESLHYPRARIAVAAAAQGLQAIDVAYAADFRDGDAAREDALAARALGFTGKVVFHPNQIAAVNAVFTPDAAAVAQARRVVDAYRAALAEGRGVFLLDGEFVAIDVVRMAERTLRRAEAAGAALPAPTPDP